MDRAGRPITEQRAAEIAAEKAAAAANPAPAETSADTREGNSAVANSAAMALPTAARTAPTASSATTATCATTVRTSPRGPRQDQQPRENRPDNQGQPRNDQPRENRQDNQGQSRTDQPASQNQNQGQNQGQSQNQNQGQPRNDQPRPDGSNQNLTREERYAQRELQRQQRRQNPDGSPRNDQGQGQNQNQGQAQNQNQNQQNQRPQRQELDLVVPGGGTFELMPDGGYGFLRSPYYNYLSSPDDVFVSPQQVKQYAMKPGDTVVATIRPPREGEKYFALVGVESMNGRTVEEVPRPGTVQPPHSAVCRPAHEAHHQAHPNQHPCARFVCAHRQRPARPDCGPAQTGKTVLLQEIANSSPKTILKFI